MAKNFDIDGYMKKRIIVNVASILCCASGLLATNNSVGGVVETSTTNVLKGDLDERMTAVRQIGQGVDSGVVTALVNCAMHDESAVVRREALLKLNDRAVSDKGARRPLLDVAAYAAKDDDGRIRSLACRILRGQLGGETTVILLETLRREFALERDQRGAKEDLRLRYGKTWWRDSVVRSCIDGLILTDTSQVNVIAEYHRRYPEGDMGYALAHVLYKLGENPDVEIMIDALGKSSSEFVKVRVIDDLAEIGDERAIPHLKVLFNDQFQIESKDQTLSYPIRMAARRAIEKIGAPNRKCM